MSRIAVPDRDDIPADSQTLLNAVARQLKFVPRLFRTAAISADALSGLIALRAAISSALDTRTLARIALVVSQVNECQYCLSLHSHLGMNYGGLSPSEMLLNRQGKSLDLKAQALVTFVRKVAIQRGKITDADFAEVFAAGYDDAHIIAIVTATAYYFFTNLINNVFETTLDFPRVDVTIDEWAADLA